MYVPTIWEDHVSSLPGVYVVSPYNETRRQYTIEEAGTAMVPGTPQDQAHLNQLETGVFDESLALSLALNFARQTGWRVDTLEKAAAPEVGTVSLTNTQKFPFNNSQKSVALTTPRENLNYIVEILSITGTGNVGEVDVTNRQVNGFKLSYTGSAAAVLVTYAVTGGFDK